MTLEWVATEARTGRVITDLPHLSVPRIAAVLGSYTTALASLPVPSAPEPWLRATTPKATTMVLLDDGVPVWGGLVLSRTRGSGDEVSMSLGTLEVWLDGVFIRDLLEYGATQANPSIPSVPQNAIVADLCTRYVIDGALPGLPLRVSGGTGGTARDRTYTDAQDKSILSALSELSGVEGGFEWTIGWEHLSSPERYCPVLYVGDRIGASPIAGLAPAATFEMPGAVTEVELTEDWSAGKGATDVIATSSAVADVVPQSPHQTSADPDRPRVEHRFTPSTSISQIPTLTAHAARVLADMADGARTLSLTAVLADAPRLGRVWALGDDVGYAIGGLEDSSETVHVGEAVVDAGQTIRTNLCPNPSFEVNLTGWRGLAGRTADGPAGTGSWAGTHTCLANGAFYVGTNAGVFSGGSEEVVSTLVWAKAPIGRSFKMRVTFRAANGTVVPGGDGYSSTVLIAGTGEWSSYSVTITAPADATITNYDVGLQGVTGWLTNDVLAIAAMLVVKGSYSGTYFDGDTPDVPGGVTYAWTGTAHASPSTETTQHWETVPAHAETWASVRESAPAFPGGLRGSARVIGWEMTLPAAGVVGTITPTLVLPGESA